MPPASSSPTTGAGLLELQPPDDQIPIYFF
jgi:hypothetical protein